MAWIHRILGRFIRPQPRHLPPGSGRAERGRFGEDLAEDFCRWDLGYRIVRRNWRRGRDEIDLVCRDGSVLVFVEVRARDEHALVPGYYSVDRHKKRVLQRACKAYMKALRRPPAHFRFDIIEVSISKEGVGRVRHYANVTLFHKHYSPLKGPHA